MSAQQEEKKDNSNYAKHFTRNPNILYDSYKHLTKEEKWLHSCLRRIFCEDAKPRYYSLRELSSLTDYSVGALSKMLPRLHKVGLIHAEVKKKKTRDGRETGNALYHITIIDIWELNKDFYSCSPNERVDPSDVLVHEMTQACSRNDTSLSHLVNDPVSSGEQDRAQNGPQKRSLRSNQKKNTEKENARVSNDTSLTHPLVFHPLHNFIALDDAIAPKVMTVFMTCNEYYSEYEDKSRERIAVEVQADLEKRGHHVTFKWEKEDVSSFKFAPEVVDAAPSTPPESEETAQGNEQSSEQAVSYSQSEQKNEAPAEPPTDQGKRKGSKGSRSKKDVPPELRERVDAFYDFLDKWRQEVMDDPDEGYNRTPTSDAAICKLLQSKKPPTRERFRIHLDEMWKEPKNERTGWHTRKKMGSIPFICKEYEERCMAVSANEQKQKGKVTSPSVNLNTVAAVAGYTQKEAEKALNPESVEELPYAGPARLRNKRGA